MVLPLWVVVTKEGLQTRIMFHGEWVFTNHLPQEVQVRESIPMFASSSWLKRAESVVAMKRFRNLALLALAGCKKRIFSARNGISI